MSVVSMLRRSASFGLIGLLALSAPVLAADDQEGVKIGKRSIFRRLVPAASVEQSAALQYDQMRREAFQNRKLLDDKDPRVVRVRKIAQELLPNAEIFNEAANQWKWEVSVFESDQINAFCMPGGKIAFFTGILDKLKLTDDEVAMIMGHEMGHALWEHARERTAKTNITGIGGRLIGGLLFGQAGEMIGAAGSSLAALKFSRNDETEADLIGMELAARAGYDPRSGVTLWEKMTKANKGAPPQWLSTHPSGKTRIKTIEGALPDVMPIYNRVKAEKKNG
jgi:Zn-dependent protease with chaperone function